jgi:hypothetical protein
MHHRQNRPAVLVAISGDQNWRAGRVPKQRLIRDNCYERYSGGEIWSGWVAVVLAIGRNLLRNKMGSILP